MKTVTIHSEDRTRIIKGVQRIIPLDGSTMLYSSKRGDVEDLLAIVPITMLIIITEDNGNSD